jgi:carboxyl-terminal processing protease
VVDAGYDPAPDRARLFFLRPSAGPVDLTVRSTKKGRPRTVNVAPEPTSGLEAGRRSVRIVERGGRKIGVLHLWMVARGSADFVQQALAGELARGGYADEIAGILAPFRAAHRKSGKGGASRTHDGGGSPDAVGSHDAVGSWKRPVVFLVDDRSRSAKELLAWNIRHEQLGPLVGEKTEGAVLGAGFMQLPGGLFLEIGMIEVPVADGSSLEGVGVEPTVAVAHAGAYAAGRDPILEKGLELARAAVTRARIAGPY